MRIQHNIMAMNAYRNYTNNVSAMKKNLEKLSSGYKINRAGDDAAGLAISEKMRAQITGLEVAQKNAKDGISLIQTAEGAMTEVHDMLNRMVELASQSANGTYDNETDRAQLQKELNQLRSEINRIADSSNFNGIKLLDGSMDGSADITKQVDFMESGVLPDVGKVLGVNTVLHSEAATTEGGTSFGVDLHNTCFANDAGTDMTIDIGGNKFSLTGDGTGDMDADAIAAAFVAKYGASGTNKADLKINGQEFSVEKATDQNGDVRLLFTQVKAPTKASEVVNASMSVNITGAGVKGKNGSTTGTIGGTAATATVIGTGGALDSTNLDGAKIAELAAEKGVKADQTPIDVNLVYDDTTKIFSLVVSPSATDRSKDVVLATYDSSGDTLPTKSSGATATPVTLNFGNLGSVDLSSTSGTITPINPTSGVYTTGLTYSTATPAPAVVTNPNNVTITHTAGNAAAVTQPDATFDLAGLDVDKECTLTITIGNKSFDIDIDANDIAADAAGTTSIDAAVATKLVAALNAEKFTDADAGDFTAAVGGSGTDITLTGANAVDEMDAAALNKMFGQGIGVALKEKFDASGASAYADYNKSTTVQNTVDVDSSSNRLASTYWTLDKSMIEDGASVQIGKTNYVFTTDATKIDPTDGNTKYVKIGDLDASSADFATQAAARLTAAAADNKTWTVGHDGNRMTFTEIKTQTEYADDDNKSTLTTKDAIAATFGYTGVEKVGKSMRLQIGDTADSFNQLQINVKDMHAKSMGIGDIDISTQEGATAAITKIKAAINYVSDVRGDLGSLQNRLDHTINNLSVMTENIQDAESTIRDVDVAEEMMAYTKNNILIQSAQAMLAQANQVPQGVLQLLQ